MHVEKVNVWVDDLQVGHEVTLVAQCRKRLAMGSSRSSTSTRRLSLPAAGSDPGTVRR